MKRILFLLALLACGPVRAAITTGPSVADAGGPTNGITASTATNIAAYQAFIATNTLVVSGGGSWTNVTTIQTNATTAQIQAAFDAGGTLWFTPSLYPYVMSTNVYLTNAVHVLGNGALIQAAAGVTNFVWDTRTNTPNGRIIIEDLLFDGRIRSNFGDNANYFRLVNGTPTLFYNPYWSNLSALRIASSAGGAVKNCQFFGWPGNGVMIVNPNVGQAHAGKRVAFVNNLVYSNFCGAFLAGEAYETAGYYNNAAPWQLVNAEYQPVRGNQFFRNYVGLGGGAANAHVQNNFFDDNQIGFHQGAAPTSGGHGLVEANTFNHNIYGGWAESCQLGQWKLNNFLGNTAAGFIGSSITELQFEGNYLGAATDKVIITNVSTGTVRNNRYQGTWAGNGWVITTTVDYCGNINVTNAANNDGVSCVNSNATFRGTVSVSGSANGALSIYESTGADLRAKIDGDSLKLTNGSTAWTVTLTNGGATFSSNVVAAKFYGDGSALTGISGGSGQTLYGSSPTTFTVGTKRFIALNGVLGAAADNSSAAYACAFTTTVTLTNFVVNYSSGNSTLPATTNVIFRIQTNAVGATPTDSNMEVTLLPGDTKTNSGTKSLTLYGTVDAPIEAYLYATNDQNQVFTKRFNNSIQVR